MPGFTPARVLFQSAFLEKLRPAGNRTVLRRSAARIKRVFIIHWITIRSLLCTSCFEPYAVLRSIHNVPRIVAVDTSDCRYCCPYDNGRANSNCLSRHWMPILSLRWRTDDESVVSEGFPGMLNLKTEWFGHIAVQLIICSAFVGVEQTSYALDQLAPRYFPISRAAATAAAHESPLNGAKSPNRRLSAPLLRTIAQNANRQSSDVAPLLLTQTAPYSQEVAGIDPLTAPVQSRKPINETSRAAVGAKPSGRSVKAKRFRPKVQSADDPTDPYIIAEAAALNNDPNQIFAFVRDQVGFNAYSGSLRGARGTLWSMAGNSLDKSSLLIALLGAAGVSAQYVQGTISLAQQQQLILSMFPNQYQVTGCPPANGTLATPAADPTLLADLSNHFWVEFGPSNTPADPSFSGDKIGTVPGTPTTAFTTIPAALQHTVTFRLDIEEYEQASALFGLGDGISTTEVLNQTFATTDLIGVPVTVGNFVSGSAAGIVISATTFTYSPYLRLGSDLSEPNNDQVVQGQSYQEVYTNFPLGTEVLTGVFVNIDVNDPGVATQTYQRAMLDRIGYAARQGNVSVQIQLASTPTPALQAVSLQTYLVSPSAIGTSLTAPLPAVAAAQDQVYQTLTAETLTIPADTQDPAQVAILQDAMQAAQLQLVMLQRVVLFGFQASSENTTSVAGIGALVLAYENSPRVLDFSSSVSQTDDTVQLELDLRKDSVYAVPYPVQQASAAATFQGARGVLESALESQFADSVAAAISGTNPTVATGAMDIFLAAQSAGIAFQQFTASSIGELSALNISANAQGARA